MYSYTKQWVTFEERKNSILRKDNIKKGWLLTWLMNKYGFHAIVKNASKLFRGNDYRSSQMSDDFTLKLRKQFYFNELWVVYTADYNGVYQRLRTIPAPLPCQIIFLKEFKIHSIYIAENFKFRKLWALAIESWRDMDI